MKTTKASAARLAPRSLTDSTIPPSPLTDHPPEVSETDTLIERLADEMGRRWRQGDRPLVEEYLALYPQLLDQPAAATELIYEEICLREEYGQTIAAEEVLSRFPQWQQQLRAILDCHQLLESGPVTPHFPLPGEALGEFQLLAELGRGTSGRVFVATQPALADRPVVLKLSTVTGREHLALARLQHTHIVPLYAVQEFPERGLRALCLPYFGGASLAKLFESVHRQPLKERTGQHLLDALYQTQCAAAVFLPVEGPACKFLKHASYVQALCWIGACLADALHYAHERGLVHLDLKPSNILLAADGQPMLLDFHLAREPIAPAVKAPVWLGGTPAYMAPEQLAALNAVREGRKVPMGVDGRADIYSLGALLYEAFEDALPPSCETSSTTTTWQRRQKTGVSVGLADILGKCLAQRPRDRYADGASLATDLRRHLGDLPLRGAGNRSLTERWRKWRRRRPRAPTLIGLIAVVLIAGGFALTQFNHQAAEARAALREGNDLYDNHRYGQAVETWKRGLEQAEGLPFHGSLANQLRDQLHQGERKQAGQELHDFVERVRALYGADGLISAEARMVANHCREIWDNRTLVVKRLGPVPAADRDQLKTDLLDLAILWTDLRVRLAPADQGNSTRREALDILGEAETLFGPSCVLYRQRQTIAAALGMTDVSEKAASLADAHSPRTAWENYSLGLAYFLSGDLEKAARQLDLAVNRRPQEFWPNFFRGKCAYAQGLHEEAVIAFSVCVALAPDSAWCFANRGLAHAALGDSDRALRDFDRALKLDPQLATAALNRGLLHYREKRFVNATADLKLALKLGADPALTHYDLALVWLAQGDREAGLASLADVLRHDPGHAEARKLRANLSEKK